jgi:hypothetical protein
MDRARVPRSVAKQIIGHKTDAMYNRYRIVDEQDIREGMTLAEITWQTRMGHIWGTVDYDEIFSPHKLLILTKEAYRCWCAAWTSNG